MAQTQALVNALKAALKTHGMTYADVAKGLGLSEASVKRLFAGNGFSLERLDAVCQLVGMEISDLVKQMQAAQKRLEQLTEQQEMELTQDLLLLLVTVCVMNRWTVKDMTRHYLVSESECVQKLAKLDRLQVIELLPGNRVKLLISPNFKWRKNGPIQRFFQEKVGREYFDVSFDEKGECLAVLNGMLSAESNTRFQKKLERLAEEFEELNNADASLPFDERDGVTLVLAMRHWEFGLFRHMQREI